MGKLDYFNSYKPSAVAVSKLVYLRVMDTELWLIRRDTLTKERWSPASKHFRMAPTTHDFLRMCELQFPVNRIL